MSRSYKKYPVIVQEKDDMRQWNRSLRHNKLKEIPNGSAYKKDSRRSGVWKYRWSEAEVREHYRRWHHLEGYHPSKFETEDDYVNWYKKEYVYK